MATKSYENFMRVVKVIAIKRVILGWLVCRPIRLDTLIYGNAIRRLWVAFIQYLGLYGDLYELRTKQTSNVCRHNDKYADMRAKQRTR